MSEMKHTPGPWRVVVDDSASQVTGFPCIEADNYQVVGTEGMYDDIETDFANAHLIAAAPDLLEALKNLLADNLMETPSTIAAYAAIAKAEGRD